VVQAKRVATDPAQPRTSEPTGDPFVGNVRGSHNERYDYKNDAPLGDGSSRASRCENKLAVALAVALAVREAMREHRRGKPVAFSWPCFPHKDGCRV
jgi:hypothetical protein